MRGEGIFVSSLMQFFVNPCCKSHVWLFEGADGGNWLRQLQHKLGITEGDSGDSGGDGTPATYFGERCEETAGCGRQVRVDDDGERSTKRQRVM